MERYEKQLMSLRGSRSVEAAQTQFEQLLHSNLRVASSLQHQLVKGASAAQPAAQASPVRQADMLVWDGEGVRECTCAGAGVHRRPAWHRCRLCQENRLRHRNLRFCAMVRMVRGSLLQSTPSC